METYLLVPDKKSKAYTLAKDIEGNIKTLTFSNPIYNIFPFIDIVYNKLFINDKVITFNYPMHLFGIIAKSRGKRWIVYDMETPPLEEFKGLQKIYVSLIQKLNNWCKEQADEHWNK